MKPFAMRSMTAVILVAFLLMLISACANKETQEPAGSNEQSAPANQLANPIIPDSAELTIIYPGNTEEVFNSRFGDNIRKKFPGYTLDYVTIDAKDFPDYVATKPTIDIMFYSWSGVVGTLLPLKLESDISDLIKKYNYDLKQFAPGTISPMQSLADGGMYGLPWIGEVFTFMYNKDIFDKFGQNYPADNMTWDEVYELARTMTRTDGDVNYHGLTLMFDHLIARNQLSAPFFDARTDKEMITDVAFKSAFDNLVRFYKIPGNELDSWYAARDLFRKDQVTAMHLDVQVQLPLVAEAMSNWDIARFPMHPDHPDIGPAIFPQYAIITSLSKSRDAAFQVIDFITSEEEQSYRAAQFAFMPSRSNVENIMKNFGATIPGIETKNVKALVTKSNAPFQGTLYYDFGLGEMGKAYQEYMGGNDLNTVLREAAERAKQKIEEAKAQQ